jgi:hypothetical protein
LAIAIGLVKRFLVLLVMCLALVAGAGAASAAQQWWIAPSVGINAWASLAPAATEAAFGTQGFGVIIPERSYPSPTYGQSTIEFKSYAKFVNATGLQAGDAVLYDPEKWSATPLAEQQHPKTYISSFTARAHVMGLIAIVAPGLSLVQVSGADCRQRSGETQHQAFVRCGFASAAKTAGTDWFLLQSQRAECNLTEFKWFVRAVEGQDQGRVLAELTAAWSNSCVTAQQISRAWKTVAPYVPGFGLWVDPTLTGRSFSQQNAIAAQALKLITGLG